MVGMTPVASAPPPFVTGWGGIRVCPLEQSSSNSTVLLSVLGVLLRADPDSADSGWGLGCVSDKLSAKPVLQVWGRTKQQGSKAFWGHFIILAPAALDPFSEPSSNGCKLEFSRARGPLGLESGSYPRT